MATTVLHEDTLTRLLRARDEIRARYAEALPLEHLAKEAALSQKGAIGCGVLEATDVRKDYEELSKKGVRFRGPPEERPYGIETLMQDDSGNWFSLVQRAR